VLHPDVTLLDLDLGAESGLEVARQLSSDPNLDPGHLILISAHAEEDFADLIDGSPAVGFLAKSALSATAIERLLPLAGDHQRGIRPRGRPALYVRRNRTISPVLSSYRLCSPRLR
jgi:CheY-like chemotaxis protein